MLYIVYIVGLIISILILALVRVRMKSEIVPVVDGEIMCIFWPFVAVYFVVNWFFGLVYRGGEWIGRLAFNRNKVAR
jgi:hypothetical protein